MLNSPIEEIKDRLDIIDVIGGYIKLQKAGANYRAVCPFHSEKKPSFFVSPARQIWRCFGCSKGGDIFAFVKEINGVEFGDALRVLAQKAGVELKREDPKIKTERQRAYDINALAYKFFEFQLNKSKTGEEAKKYLLERGLKEETIKEWYLGYAPDVWNGLSDFLVSKGYKREEIEKAGLALKSERTGNYYDRFRGRIMFPIFDLSSQAVGFGGRVLKDKSRPDKQEEAKYINTPATILYDKSRILYGLNKASVEIRRNNNCVIVEGYMDAIMAHQAGTKNIVATSGTALTSYQLKILKRYSENISTAFDMDIAGDSATKRGIDLAQTIGFNIKIVVMPEGLDPGDVAKDPQNWQNLINNPKTIHDFYFETTSGRFDKNSLEGKKEISKLLLPVIKRIPNKIEQTYWVGSLANILSVKETDVLEELAKIRNEGDKRITEEESEQIYQSAIGLPQKSKRDILEEHLAVLAVKRPENIEILKEEDLAFFSDKARNTIKFLKENGFDFSVYPEEKKQEYDIFFLKAEAIFEDEKQGKTEQELSKMIEDEFKCCLNSIKSLAIKCKLDDLCLKIKKAEQEKNQENQEKIKELMEEFDRCSKSLYNLETA